MVVIEFKGCAIRRQFAPGSRLSFLRATALIAGRDVVHCQFARGGQGACDDHKDDEDEDGCHFVTTLG